MSKTLQLYTIPAIAEMLKPKSSETINVAFDETAKKLKGVNSLGETFSLDGKNSAGIKLLKKTISAQEILTLKTTPIVLLERLNVGILMPISLNIIYNFGTVAYADDRTLRIGYDGAAAGEQSFSKKGFLTEIVSIFRQILRKEGVSDVALLQQDIVLSADNDTTLGDGTLTIYLTYLETT